MISYYELLTLVKDKKQPDKVKYNNAIYKFDGEDYHNEQKFELLKDRLFMYSDINLIYEKSIEIIEEKPKEIEKIEINGEYYLPSKELCDDYEFKKFVLDDLQVRNKTIEEIRKAVNYLLKESKHE